ncbi:hypothetical protein EMIHUDRAFT_458504 [Emiliania huxleyi CCMP1516]|uniref:AB hydrolase-1 domain-containing protein n=2 Tax=Emiliania huxleyi TaxID=2903 RepID=A0A0D3JBB6_EMIH1|nr:hypothetical protein EMIHUDRAFT_458504 [Emiliania huxleyi CCMP1516]EOD20801.1 hypothetical protein EMIHUDRAFT_458504 [Emiliania huxleyi CCMP1516]|eukprot:XP_005773230.1 hypothetical protein EMIHUDRAFT_458504 [Emiliania huxleyi CCMP1516]
MGTPTLADLGYAYVPVPTGDPDDFVLRSADGGGFEWKGQANYDAVGAAAVAWIREQLVAHCGLHAVPCAGGATAYSSSGLKGSSAPLLLLVCGSAPGGDAGVWGRSLCINDSTRSGAMFGYVRRAQRLGWGVLIADPHGGDGCPHAHLAQLWRSTVEPAAAARVLVVAHSYGGPAEAEAGPAAAMMRPLLSRFAAAAPHAFEEPAGRWQGAAPAEVLAAVGRNFVASDESLGATLHAAPHELVALSAGTLRHPDTTHAAEEAVFHFLTRGADGEAAAANDAVRAGERAWPPPPPSQRLHALLAVLAVSILLAVVAVMLRAA